jgi:hypothetical protein
MKNGMSSLLLPQLAGPAELDLLADHIADFSLGGLKALRR